MKHFLLLSFLVSFLIILGINSSNAQNKSLLFNGSSNKVVIPNHSDFDFTAEFTLEAWIYANNWKEQTWQGSVINKDAELSGITGGYMFRVGAGGRMEGIVTPGWVGPITGTVLKDKAWNHVAMVFKEGEMWLYANGSMEAYKGGLPTAINKSTANLQFGDSPGFPGRFWDGKIDEVRIWNKARTQNEIQQNMTVDLQGTEDGLVAYYSFNENNDSGTLTDKTGNGHNGTLVNYGSNYTWVNGYELIQNDLSIVGIVNPCNSPDWSNAERIQIVIQNTATTSVSNYNVSFEYKGKVYTETVTETIEPSQTYVHTFNKFIDLAFQNEVSIKASVSYEQDADPTNNVLEKSYVRTNAINLMNRVQHNFGAKGQTQNSSITLPDDNSDYSQLLLHIKVDCPMSGCDPWDQMGNVKIKKDGIEFEIARFITPYRKACGPWTVDVSDFRSILTGTVDVITFIQVWGSSGWLLSLDLEYVKGDVEKPFTQIIPLYELDAQVYGDPNVSYDLPEQSVLIPTNCQTTHVRMTNTGHGQANTNNAAEFMEAYHHMWINGVDMFTHHLWKGDCDQNSCSPQSGTWKYARAGWCPGQQVNPVWFDLTDVMTPGEAMSFDYVLQDYKNYLNTGYNSGTHTEPFYRIYSYLYMASDSPFDNYSDLAVDSVKILDGSTEGIKVISLKLTNKGSLNIENAKISYVVNNSDAITENVILNLAPGVSTTYDIQVADLDVTKPGLLVAFADSENDRVISNNSKAIGFGNYASASKNTVQQNMNVYPNPAHDLFAVVSPKNKLSNITIFNSIGQQVYENEFTNRIQINTDEINGSGMLLIKVACDKQSYFKKIVIN